MEVTPEVKLEKYTFPKKIGIVFLERRKRVVENDSKSSNLKKEGDELSLDFDQDACAFFLLHMNHYQNTFEFQVIDLDTIPKMDNKESLLDWLDRFALENSNLNINYWMGITSEPVAGHKTWHFDKKTEKETKSSRLLWIITSRGWEKHRSPPSLFEYLLVTLFRCALESLNREIEDEELQKLEFLRHKLHKVTRGCIFDFTHRRTSVSIFKLCFGCKQKLSLLEKSIKEKGNDINLVSDVATLLSKEWMGTPEKRDSPLYDLKKIYKYDIDRNSGFNKGLREKLRDNIIDNFAQWTVGTVVTGLIGIIFTIIFNY